MRLLRRLTITARITIGSLIVATLFGAAAVIGVRIGVDSILNGSTTTLLRHDMAPFVETIAAQPEAPLARPGENQLVEVTDAQGRVRLSTLPPGLQSAVRPLLTRPDSGGTGSSGTSGASGGTADGSDGPGGVVPQHVQAAGASYLVAVQSVSGPGGVWKVVAARNDEANELVLNGLSVALIIGAIAVVLAFGVASWVLSRTALQPVAIMRQQAERLASGSSSELLRPGEARDELSELATTLNDLITQLRASAEREKQLLSDASHELRTPLAVLQGQLELAELDSGDADALMADLRASHATVLRLSALATNLLELNRIESGVAEGRARWDELVDELAQAVDSARTYAITRAPAVAIAIDFEVRAPAAAAEADPTVPVSRRELRRILNNLFSNAVKALADAGTDGSVTATLSLHSHRMELHVVDDGPGMPPEFLRVAFDRFTRADTARSTRDGSGLGLAIVAAIAERAGGWVRVENVAPHGLSVRFSVPTSTA